MIRSGSPIASFKVGDVIIRVKPVKLVSTDKSGTVIDTCHDFRTPHVLIGVENNLIYLRSVGTVLSSVKLSNPIRESMVLTDGIVTADLLEFSKNWDYYRLPESMLHSVVDYAIR